MEAIANQITSPEFFEGGKAIFTVSNPVGEHYTFRINHKKETPFFVSLLTGPDNISDYTYLGVYVPQNKTVVLTDKSKFKDDTTPRESRKMGYQKSLKPRTCPQRILNTT